MNCLPGGRRLLLAVCVAGLLASPRAAAGSEGLSRLPNVEVRSLAASKDVRLPEALAGKPSLILLTDGVWPAQSPAGQSVADIQHNYATWFAWVAVASGSLAAADIAGIQESAPARFDRLYHDRQGLLREGLGIDRLPVLLLVDASGAVRASCPPDGDARGLTDAARALWNEAGPSRWRNAGIKDFRLPQVGGSALVSFLDVAGQEGTMVAFLNSRCLACARELEVLDSARQRRGGRVSFVAVFIDPAPDSRIRGFLAAAGATPDHVLRDTELRLAGRYAIRSAPALLVIDTVGGIVFSRTGYREGDRDELFAALMRAFDEAAPTAAAASAVGEARRLHEEANKFLREGKPGDALLFQERIRELLPDYPSVHLRIAEAALANGRREQALESLVRYLAADPQTYDSAAVRRMITGLSAPGR